MNDLSLHGQFADHPSFCAALDRLMSLRVVAERFGRRLILHRILASAQVTPALNLSAAVGMLSRDKARVIMQWLSGPGPYWEDDRAHSPDDYLECNGEVVTDSAIGEAAVCRMHGLDRQLVSFAPSCWDANPLDVTLAVVSPPETSNVEVPNHTGVDTLEAALQASKPPLTSWVDLAKAATETCSNLVFTPDAFLPLTGTPYHPGVAERLLQRLNVLNRLRVNVDGQGHRTPEGQRLYQEHFTGDKAWFSDSSDTEKRDFKADLTFGNPTKPEERLFCPWHGKVKTPQLRIHFTWPVAADEDLVVVFVGPKITKK